MGRCLLILLWLPQLQKENPQVPAWWEGPFNLYRTAMMKAFAKLDAKSIVKNLLLQ